jgi:hypothetical protein
MKHMHVIIIINSLPLILAKSLQHQIRHQIIARQSQNVSDVNDHVPHLGRNVPVVPEGTSARMVVGARQVCLSKELLSLGPLSRLEAGQCSPAKVIGNLVFLVPYRLLQANIDGLAKGVREPVSTGRVASSTHEQPLTIDDRIGDTQISSGQ